MSGPAWKRRPVGAWASEGNLSNGKKSWSNIEDFEEEETLIKTRFFHRTHLKLVDPPKNEPSVQIVSMKAPAVHTVTVDVDIKATQTKENDSDEYKQEIQYRPVSSVPTGEVKRTSIATFPCSDELPSADDLPLGDLGRIEHPDQVLAVERGCTRTPPLVPVEKTATTKTGSPYQRGSCPTQQGAARAQPKRSRQHRNHERRHWPAGLGKGEVKQSKTGSFPPAFNLLDNGLPSDDHESVAPDHVQILERKD